MASGEGNAPSGGASAQGVADRRSIRWASSEYGDETKLRELSAKQARLAARKAQQIARLNTRIDRLRHHAAVLREKAVKVREPIGLLTQQITSLHQGIQQATGGDAKASTTADVTKMQYKARKLEQKVANRQAKASRLEAAAAHHTQRATESKVKADRLAEAQHAAEAESIAYRQRADNLQGTRQANAGASSPGNPPSAPP